MRSYVLDLKSLYIDSIESLKFYTEILESVYAVKFIIYLEKCGLSDVSLCINGNMYDMNKSNDRIENLSVRCNDPLEPNVIEHISYIADKHVRAIGYAAADIILKKRIPMIWLRIISCSSIVVSIG